MQALTVRHSSREFSPRKLPPSVLSKLLWAAFGINRAQTGGRTAPSAYNGDEIDVYVATADGLFCYDARKHALRHLPGQDIRASTGTEPDADMAPVILVYIADLSRIAKATREEQARYAGTEAGFIAENVYLFCAAEELATQVHGLGDRPRLAKLMTLAPDQQVILAQSVGYPAGTP